MKLHCGVGPNFYRVHIFPGEKNVDVPKADVDLMKAIASSSKRGQKAWAAGRSL